MVHTQNVNPNLNIGFNLNFVGSRNFYASNRYGQNVSNLNARFLAGTSLKASDITYACQFDFSITLNRPKQDL
jgi:hypothetical protein